MMMDSIRMIMNSIQEQTGVGPSNTDGPTNLNTGNNGNTGDNGRSRVQKQNRKALKRTTLDHFWHTKKKKLLKNAPFRQAIADHVSNLIDCMYRCEEVCRKTYPSSGISFVWCKDNSNSNDGSGGGGGGGGEGNPDTDSTQATAATPVEAQAQATPAPIAPVPAPIAPVPAPTATRTQATPKAPPVDPEVHPDNDGRRVVRMGLFRVTIEREHVALALKQFRRLLDGPERVKTQYDYQGIIINNRSNNKKSEDESEWKELIDRIKHYEILLGSQVDEESTDYVKMLVALFNDVQEAVVEPCLQAAGMAMRQAPVHSVRTPSRLTVRHRQSWDERAPPVVLEPMETGDATRGSVTDRDNTTNNTTTTNTTTNNNSNTNNTNNSEKQNPYAATAATECSTKPCAKDRKLEFSIDLFPDERAMANQLSHLNSPMSSSGFTSWDDLHILHRGMFGPPYMWDSFMKVHIKVAEKHGFQTSFRSKSPNKINERHKDLNPELRRNQRKKGIEQRRNLFREYANHFSCNEWKEPDTPTRPRMAPTAELARAIVARSLAEKEEEKETKKAVPKKGKARTALPRTTSTRTASARTASARTAPGWTASARARTVAERALAARVAIEQTAAAQAAAARAAIEQTAAAQAAAARAAIARTAARTATGRTQPRKSAKPIMVPARTAKPTMVPPTVVPPTMVPPTMVSTRAAPPTTLHTPKAPVLVGRNNNTNSNPNSEGVLPNSCNDSTVSKTLKEHKGVVAVPEAVLVTTSEWETQTQMAQARMPRVSGGVVPSLPEVRKSSEVRMESGGGDIKRKTKTNSNSSSKNPKRFKVDRNSGPEKQRVSDDETNAPLETVAARNTMRSQIPPTPVAVVGTNGSNPYSNPYLNPFSNPFSYSNSDSNGVRVKQEQQGAEPDPELASTHYRDLYPPTVIHSNMNALAYSNNINNNNGTIPTPNLSRPVAYHLTDEIRLRF